MAKTIQINIAVAVGSNGKVYALNFEGDDTDWAFAEDCLSVWDGSLKDPVYPDTVARYVVEAELIQPSAHPKRVKALAVTGA